MTCGLCPQCQATALGLVYDRSLSIREATFQCPACGTVFVLKWLQNRPLTSENTVESGKMASSKSSGPTESLVTTQPGPGPALSTSTEPKERRLDA